MARNVADLEIISKRKGLKIQLKRLMRFQSTAITIGIHKGEGGKLVQSAWREWLADLKKYGKLWNLLVGEKKRRFSDPDDYENQFKDKSHSTRKRKIINIATLAKVLETGGSWIQGKNMTVYGANHEKINIHKGARMKMPARYFVNLGKVPEAYTKAKSIISQQLKILSENIKIKSINTFWETIGKNILELQQQQITGKKTVSNSELTKKIKGFDHPLFGEGNLLGSLKFKRDNHYAPNSKNSNLSKLYNELNKMK